MKKSEVKAWKSRIEACRSKRKKLVDGPWKDNVAYRVGKPFKGESSTDRVAVPIDWSFTKAKVASLYSQDPVINLTPKHPRYAQAVPIFAKELNDVLRNEVRVSVAMEEALVDAVNASGIAGVMVGYLATFEDVEVPESDISVYPLEVQRMLLASGQVQMTTVKRPVSERLFATRISPANLIWDTSFTGSDFDDSSFVGYEGSLTWAQAKRQFKLTDAQKEAVLKGDNPKSLRDDESGERDSDDNNTVHFTKLFYRAADFNPDELYFERIHQLVFVDGIDEPVVDEPLEWQQFDEKTGQYVGVCKYPIRLLTLTYISDEPVPPSDSEIGRPQVDETMRSRSQMIQQRDYSKPLRWANTDRVDPMVLEAINKGEWQGVIPVQGDGSRMLGEVARANYPAEQWDFDRVTRTDLQEAWQVGPNQTGQFASGERSASESNIVQANFATRIGVERAKVAKFFCGIAEVVAGLMQLYWDRPEEFVTGPEGQQAIDQVWDRTKVEGAKFVFDIVPDSTVLLDAQAKVDRLMKFINLTGKSGFVNVEPIIAEIAALSGLNPAEVMTKPQPPAPEGANISLRLSGSEDLSNPIVVAMLLKENRMPGEQEIQAAKALLADAMAPMQPPQVPEVTSGPVPQAALPPGPAENWGPMERVTKRVEELGG